MQDEIAHMKEENTRLRHQLEARASGSAPPPNLPHSNSRPNLHSMLSQSTGPGQARADSAQGASYPAQGPPPPGHEYPYGADRGREERGREEEERWAAGKGKG